MQALPPPALTARRPFFCEGLSQKSHLIFIEIHVSNPTCVTWSPPPAGFKPDPGGLHDLCLFPRPYKQAEGTGVSPPLSPARQNQVGGPSTKPGSTAPHARELKAAAWPARLGFPGFTGRPGRLRPGRRRTRREEPLLRGAGDSLSGGLLRRSPSFSWRAGARGSRGAPGARRGGLGEKPPRVWPGRPPPHGGGVAGRRGGKLRPGGEDGRGPAGAAARLGRGSLRSP